MGHHFFAFLLKFDLNEFLKPQRQGLEQTASS